ncbi:MAG: hypothetical protein HDS64_06650 [Bacteroidales bacterium]|nr:hypothetical protein [Bacteroidales bacterium]
MKIKPTNKKLLSRIILHAMDNPSALGLLSGQMGIILVVSQCAKQFDMSVIDQSADFLFEHISNNIGRITDIGFGRGLSGICWGVEYLVQHSIMPGPANDICEDIDKRIMETDIRRTDDFSLESGALGKWHYVQARIQGNLSANLALPFDKIYLDDWHTLIKRNEDKFPIGALKWLESARNNLLIPYQLSVIPFVEYLRKRPQTNLSLQTGIAGYIATHYLKDV